MVKTLTREWKDVRQAVLAHKDGLELVMQLLLHQGAMCPKCGFGTRAAGKKWAKCKRCGHKVERRKLP